MMERIRRGLSWLRDNFMSGVLILMGLASHLSTAMMSVLIGIGILFFLLDVWQKRIGHPFRPIDWAAGVVFGAFSVSILLEALLSLEPGRSLSEAASTIFHMVPFFLALFYVRSWRVAGFILTAFAVSALLNDVWAYLQVKWKIESGWGPGRPVGFSKSPTFLGSFMLLTIPLLLLVPHALPGWIRRIFLWGCGIFSMYILVLSQTRGAWLAFGGVLLLFVLLNRRHRAICLSGLVILVLSGAMLYHTSPVIQDRWETMSNEKFQSNTERVLMWKGAAQIFADHPVFGVGQGEFGLVYNRDYLAPEAKERPRDPNNPRSGHGHPHNNLLKVLSERGLVGIAFFLLLHGFILWELLRALRRGEGKKAYAFALAGILTFAGVQFEGMTDTNLQLAHIVRTYWFLMGLCLATGQIREG